MKTIQSLRMLSLLTGILLGVSACQNDEPQPAADSVSALAQVSVLVPAIVPGVTYCDTPTVVRFLAGQTIEAGSVTVGNDATDLYVTFTTTDGWHLFKTHLYVGACELMPLNNGGNLAPGQFPFATDHTPYVDTYTYKIPLSRLSSSCICVAAHAEVSKADIPGDGDKETAWGEGVRVSESSWAMKFEYCIKECIQEPPTDTLCYKEETAWAAGTRYTAKGNWATFTAYDGTAKTVTLFAGQTIPVGTVTFSDVSGTGVTLTIALAPEWSLQDVSESVKIQGYNTAPSGNPAPGQFTTYKGTGLTTIVSKYNFYGIHLDVRKVIPCPVE